VETALSDLRGEMIGFHSELRAELRAELNGMRDELRVEIRSGDEETRKQMRVLHEDVIARLALIPGRPPKPKTAEARNPVKTSALNVSRRPCISRWVPCPETLPGV
jgi:hypothetical protein